MKIKMRVKVSLYLRELIETMSQYKKSCVETRQPSTEKAKLLRKEDNIIHLMGSEEHHAQGFHVPCSCA